MPASFSIQAVAERTGLTPHVIRAWERRYRAIKPARSQGRHRLYSEDEIDRLSLLHRAVRAGHSIGQIAALSSEELRQLAGRAISQPRSARQVENAETIRAEAMQAVAMFAASELDQALQRGLVSLGHQGLLRLVAAPLAQEIGDRWRAGEFTAAHEHFFTAALKNFLGNLARQFAVTETAPTIVIATPANQLHELGAVLIAAESAHVGWRVVYLGSSLPAPEIAGAAEQNGAAAVALSIVYPDDDPNLPNEIGELARLLPTGTELVVGGRAAASYRPALEKAGAIYVSSLEEFSEHLDSIRRMPRRASEH